jgi:hypothetical protein
VADKRSVVAGVAVGVSPADLRSADALILTTRWDDWDEPNASSELGSSAPSQVVDRFFCLRAREGSYRLFERCSASEFGSRGVAWKA